MKYTKSLFFLTLLFYFPQCATPPQSPNVVLPKSQSTYSSHKARSLKYNDIDLNKLFVELDMDQPIKDLGFEEKSFNTCGIEANKSKDPFCQKLYVSRLNFQVMCRESTGTVEKVRLTPLADQTLRWKGVVKRGFTKTNTQGFGRLGFVTRRPASRGHIYLYLGRKVARKRFLDNWKLILPKSWCALN